MNVFFAERVMRWSGGGTSRGRYTSSITCCGSRDNRRDLMERHKSEETPSTHRETTAEHEYTYMCICDTITYMYRYMYAEVYIGHSDNRGTACMLKLTTYRYSVTLKRLFLKVTVDAPDCKVECVKCQSSVVKTRKNTEFRRR